MRATGTVQTLSILGGRRKAILLGIKISKSLKAVYSLLKFSFRLYVHSRSYFVLKPGYEGQRSRETSLDFLVKHESQFDMFFPFPVTIFTNDSKESPHREEMHALSLFLPL